MLNYTGSYGTDLNVVYTAKPSVWGGHSKINSVGKRQLVYVGSGSDLSKLSDERVSNTGKVKPTGHGPDQD